MTYPLRPHRDGRFRSPGCRRPTRAGGLASVEVLEGRTLLATSGASSPPPAITPIETITQGNLPQPVGDIPAQIRGAYGFDSIRFAGGIKGDGTGETIAIVDAYDQPNIKADLHSFDAQFGLPDPPSFRVVAQNGSANLPAKAPVGSWGVEISLDVEWAHALAPGANILLVEANSASGDLFTAATFAATQPGVVAVSMSWGSAEFAGEALYDGDFTTPAGHTGVTFLAATGDSGAPGEYPAASPNVVAVGGTQFTSPLDAQGDYTGETAWGDGVSGAPGSGGGLSPYESQPAYQHGVVTQSATARATPDVAFDANTGVAVYDSSDYPFNPWVDIGGTSLATPEWAALIAIADQGAVAIGHGTLGNQAADTALYALAARTGSAAFHDIVTGSNGNAAGAGYDLVTGLGTPRAPSIAAALSGNIAASTPTAPSGNVFSTSPTFQWSAVAGAQSYHLVAYDQLTDAKAIDVVVGTTSYTPAAGTFTPGRAYGWEVEALAGVWTTGTPSASLGFILPVGTLPTAVAPADGSVVSATVPTLTWSAVAGAAYYGVTLFDQANPTVPLLKQVRASGTTFTLAAPLAAGHAYGWAVQAYFGQGGVGYFAPASKTATFVVAPLAAPGPLAPAPSSSTSNTSPTFQWSAVPGAAGYDLIVDDVTAGTTVFTAANLTGLSASTTTPLIIGHSYQWSVTAVDAEGNPGTSARAVGFTVVVPPPVVAPRPSTPIGTVKTARPILQWSTVAGATGYGVQIVDQTPGAHSSAFPLAHIAGTSYIPGSPLLAGHTYTWQVVAYGPAGAASAWSSSLTFTVKDEANDDFDGVGRSETAVSTPAGGFLTIVNPVTGSLRYAVYGTPGGAAIPAPGDYDGVGRTEVATYTPSTGTWTIWNPVTGGVRSFVFGGPGTIPIPGDYDGVGRTEMAVYKASTATWTILNPVTGTTRSVSWGGINYWDIPVPGDYDGVGRTELAAFVPGNATWYIVNPVANSIRTVTFGATNYASIPAAGDYDGVGYTQMAVFAPSSATWTIWNPTTNAQRHFTAGATGLHDVPLESPMGSLYGVGLVKSTSSSLPGAKPAVTVSVSVSVPSGPAVPTSTPNPTPPKPTALGVIPITSWKTVGQATPKQSVLLGGVS